MGWVADQAAEIAATIRARDYLAAEYDVVFITGGRDCWVAEKCPLCCGSRTFTLRESEDRLGDWSCARCPAEDNDAILNRGDLLDLVMRRHGQGKADAVRRILDLGARFQVPRIDSTRVLKLAAEYFRFTRGRQPRVLQYLEGRGINVEALDDLFHLGGNDVEELALQGYLSVALGRPCGRHGLARAGVALVKGKRLVLKPAVTAPLLEEDGEFVGLQLRQCGGQEPRYLNRGLAPDDRERFLYGLHSQQVREAIAAKNAVVVAEGVFDAWACFQRGAHHVLATLGRGMTHQQYSRLEGMKVAVMVLGFKAEQERRHVLAMAKGDISKLVPTVKVLELLTKAEANRRREFALDHALRGVQLESIEDMLRGREQVIEANQRAGGLALVRRARSLHRHEQDAGRYFVVPVDEVNVVITRRNKSNKAISRLLVELLDRHRGRDRRESRGRYLKVPHAFVDERIHQRAGACLRLLMYLHTKQAGPNRPVNIANDTIAEALGFASGLPAQKRKLRQLGLLVAVPPAGKDRRAWQHYPFFIPVVED